MLDTLCIAQRGRGVQGSVLEGHWVLWESSVWKLHYRYAHMYILGGALVIKSLCAVHVVFHSLHDVLNTSKQHTFLLNDINGDVDKVLKLKVSLILRIHCPDVQGKVLWRSKRHIKDSTQTSYKLGCCK